VASPELELDEPDVVPELVCPAMPSSPEEVLAAVVLTAAALAAAGNGSA
jgi:hypothetical protein